MARDSTDRASNLRFSTRRQNDEHTVAFMIHRTRDLAMVGLKVYTRHIHICQTMRMARTTRCSGQVDVCCHNRMHTLVDGNDDDCGSNHAHGRQSSVLVLRPLLAKGGPHWFSLSVSNRALTLCLLLLDAYVRAILCHVSFCQGTWIFSIGKLKMMHKIMVRVLA